MQIFAKQFWLYPAVPHFKLPLMNRYFQVHLWHDVWLWLWEHAARMGWWLPLSVLYGLATALNVALRLRGGFGQAGQFFFLSLCLRLFLLFDPPRRESGWAQISSQLPSENTQCTFLYICYLFFKLFCFIHSSMHAGILILSKTCFEICLSQHLVFTHFRDNQQHICKYPILPLTFSYQKCSGLPNLGSDSKQYM